MIKIFKFIDFVWSNDKIFKNIEEENKKYIVRKINVDDFSVTGTGSLNRNNDWIYASTTLGNTITANITTNNVDRFIKVEKEHSMMSKLRAYAGLTGSYWSAVESISYLGLAGFGNRLFKSGSQIHQQLKIYFNSVVIANYTYTTNITNLYYCTIRYSIKKNTSNTYDYTIYYRIHTSSDITKEENTISNTISSYSLTKLCEISSTNQASGASSIITESGIMNYIIEYDL